MDHGWIKTISLGEEMIAQISVASEGGSGLLYQACPLKWVTLMQYG